MEEGSVKIDCFDGFTEHHLRFECEIFGDASLVSGEYFDAAAPRGTHSFEFEFPIEEAQIAELVVCLSSMKRRYSIAMEDVGGLGSPIRKVGTVI